LPIFQQKQKRSLFVKDFLCSSKNWEFCCPDSFRTIRFHSLVGKYSPFCCLSISVPTWYEGQDSRRNSSKVQI